MSNPRFGESKAVREASTQPVTQREQVGGREIESLLDQHERVRECSLSLVASENLMSPAALRVVASDAAHRYTLPPREERTVEIWDYPNQDCMNQIERQTRLLATELFAAGYADVRPLSGNNAVFCVIAALAKPGDRVMRVPDHCGGHFATPPIADLLGLELIDIPYDQARGEVDIDEMARIHREVRPVLTLFDASMVLFPTPLRKIRMALGDKAVISCDISHPMGIIGGGGFQNPLTEGADLMHGSTHKSLFGPQKGMILCKESGQIADRIMRTVVPTFASNIHSHHVAALGVALEEMQAFGKEYATQVVANAKALARELERNGLRVCGRKRGYTNCHQIWMPLGSRSSANDAMVRLEEVGIFVNAISVPFSSEFGLRMGLCELTRRGMMEDEMGVIAELMAGCIGAKEEKSMLKAAVRDLSARFRGVIFTFRE